MQNAIRVDGIDSFIIEFSIYIFEKLSFFLFKVLFQKMSVRDIGFKEYGT